MSAYDNAVSLLTGFFRAGNKTEVAKAEINEVEVKVIEVGTSGTESYSGYLQEEYLADLRGVKGAKIYDKMRRGDPKLVMALSAVKNPIKSADWAISPKKDATDEQAIERQRILIERILFHDLKKNWKKQVGEYLTIVDFGHAEFEITYKPYLDSPIGSYNGLKSLKLLSQKTIERFNVNPDGTLKSVSQYAYGDNGRTVEIDADYLLHFALNKEGDNYEGISLLRACYGAWLRKQEALRSEAVGNQNFSRPIPIGKFPDGEQNQIQRTIFENAIRAYARGTLNYLIIPDGFDVQLQAITFDPAKLRETVKAEGVEMVNAFLANFLELGQSGSGSYALSFDLSDFFLGGLEHIADEICETINTNLIPKLIALNFGEEECLVELTCTGIRDRFGAEFANVLKTLVDAMILTPDQPLEESIRKRLKLTPMDEETARKKPEPTNPFGGGGSENPNAGVIKAQLAEKKSPNVSKQIASYTDDLIPLYKEELTKIGKAMIKKIVAEYEKSSGRNDFKIASQVDAKGVSAYKAILTDEYLKITENVYDATKTEFPKNVQKQLSERFQFADVKGKNKNRVRAKAGLIADVQVADLEKAIRLQWQSSVGSTDSTLLIQSHLLEAVEKYVEGQAIPAGASAQAGQLVNEGRQDMFEEVKDEIESYTFVNGDPKSDICAALAGTTFSVDDPNLGQYTPPLHFNCKSYMVANLKEYRDNPPIDGNKLDLSKELIDSIQFNECKCGAPHK